MKKMLMSLLSVSFIATIGCGGMESGTTDDDDLFSGKGDDIRKPGPGQLASLNDEIFCSIENQNKEGLVHVAILKERPEAKWKVGELYDAQVYIAEVEYDGYDWLFLYNENLEVRNFPKTCKIKESRSGYEFECSLKEHGFLFDRSIGSIKLPLNNIEATSDTCAHHYSYSHIAPESVTYPDILSIGYMSRTSPLIYETVYEAEGRASYNSLFENYMSCVVGGESPKVCTSEDIRFKLRRIHFSSIEFEEPTENVNVVFGTSEETLLEKTLPVLKDYRLNKTFIEIDLDEILEFNLAELPHLQIHLSTEEGFLFERELTFDNFGPESAFFSWKEDEYRIWSLKVDFLLLDFLQHAL